MKTENEQDEERVQQAIQTLSDHFESVVIFTVKKSPNRPGGSAWAVKATGCLFQRLGVVTEWLEREREITRCEARMEFERRRKEAEGE